MPDFTARCFRELLGVLMLVALTSPVLASGIDTAENVGNLPINVEGVMGMTLVNKGGAVYVGIGTSAPYMPLTIHTGTDQNLGVISANGWGVSGIALQSYKDDLSSSEPLLLQGSTLYLQATGGEISIGTSASPTATISINGNMNVTGKVGIGTTSPIGNLDIENGSDNATLCLNGTCVHKLPPQLQLVKQDCGASPTCTVTCSTGSVAGGGCFVGNDMSPSSSFPSGNGWYCSTQNWNSAGDLQAFATCMSTQ
jgi:hypothetical protein